MPVRPERAEGVEPFPRGRRLRGPRTHSVAARPAYPAHTVNSAANPPVLKIEDVTPCVFSPGGERPTYMMVNEHQSCGE